MGKHLLCILIALFTLINCVAIATEAPKAEEQWESKGFGYEKKVKSVAGKEA